LANIQTQNQEIQDKLNGKTSLAEGETKESLKKQYETNKQKEAQLLNQMRQSQAAVADISQLMKDLQTNQNQSNRELVESINSSLGQLGGQNLNTYFTSANSRQWSP
jgi:hydroxylamine reductase (hybrid-cluster protein)